ncbi:MAG: hypothetical protein ACK52K_11820 [Alphaproteobacteria bacterium]
MYKEYVGPNFKLLDEDAADIEAVHQQLLAIKRLVGNLQMSSGAGRRWQEEMQENIVNVLHDTSTGWLVKQGRDLVAIREPS